MCKFYYLILQFYRETLLANSYTRNPCSIVSYSYSYGYDYEFLRCRLLSCDELMEPAASVVAAFCGMLTQRCDSLGF